MNISYHEFFSKAKRVTRYSGTNLLQPESVESHILEMCGIAFDFYFKSPDFDLNLLLRLILVHDFDEFLTVDIPRPFKYFDESFRNKLDETTHKYLVSLGLNEEFIAECSNAKKKGYEGKLLHLIDLIQVEKKLTLEVNLGNSLIKPNLKEVQGYIKEFLSTNKSYLKYV